MAQKHYHLVRVYDSGSTFGRWGHYGNRATAQAALDSWARDEYMFVRDYNRELQARNANLRSADLRNANLRGADLSGADLIDIGQDSRGFHWLAVPWADGIRIKAGCRWFTTEEARRHWGAAAYATEHGNSVQSESLARLEALIVIGAVRWPETINQK